MIDNKQFIINEKLLNDIKCQHNSKKNSYIKYCKTCKKNICIWCKEHNNHETIELEKLEPNQEKFEKTEKAIKQMNSMKKKIEEKYLQFKNFYEQISKTHK